MDENAVIMELTEIAACQVRQALSRNIPTALADLRSQIQRGGRDTITVDVKVDVTNHDNDLGTVRHLSVKVRSCSWGLGRRSDTDFTAMDINPAQPLLPFKKEEREPAGGDGDAPEVELAMARMSFFNLGLNAVQEMARAEGIVLLFLSSEQEWLRDLVRWDAEHGWMVRRGITGDQFNFLMKELRRDDTYVWNEIPGHGDSLVCQMPSALVIRLRDTYGILQVANEDMDDLERMKSHAAAVLRCVPTVIRIPREVYTRE